MVLSHLAGTAPVPSGRTSRKLLMRRERGESIVQGVGDCQFGEWSEWSECSATCAGRRAPILECSVCVGDKERNRTIESGEQCLGRTEMSSACGDPACATMAVPSIDTMTLEQMQHYVDESGNELPMGKSVHDIAECVPIEKIRQIL